MNSNSEIEKYIQKNEELNELNKTMTDELDKIVKTMTDELDKIEATYKLKLKVLGKERDAYRRVVNINVIKSYLVKQPKGAFVLVYDPKNKYNNETYTGFIFDRIQISFPDVGSLRVEGRVKPKCLIVGSIDWYGVEENAQSFSEHFMSYSMNDKAILPFKNQTFNKEQVMFSSSAFVFCENGNLFTSINDKNLLLILEKYINEYTDHRSKGVYTTDEISETLNQSIMKGVVTNESVDYFFTKYVKAPFTMIKLDKQETE